MMLRRSIPALLIVAAATAAAQDPVAVSPGNYKIEVENAWVRVLRVTQEPQEKTPMHQHPASVSVYLTDVHQRLTGEDRRVREVKHKPGDVAFAAAVKRTEENLSDRPLELVLIELKPGAPKPVSPPITL